MSDIRMNHYDEHIIELYVLRSETVEDRREEIERHLAECHGCRSLATEIEQFYAGFEKALAEPKDAEPINPTALARAPRSLEPYFEPYTAVSDLRESSLTGRMRYFIRRYPIATGAGSFALAAALVGLALFQPGRSTAPADTNPSYHHINTQSGMLEVFNNVNEKLWELPLPSFTQATPEVVRELNGRIIIADIDGDGKNELITGIPLGGQPGGINALTVYSPDRSLRFERFFRSPITFRGIAYDDRQSVERVIVGPIGPPQGREIFVLANYGRSPTILYRVSNEGTVLGEYYHFGAGHLDTLRIPGRERPYLAFFGQNNVGEPDSLTYAILTLLDPDEITGRSEASDSRGFGLPVSAAEEFVIRLPQTDMSHYLNSPSQTGYIRPSVSEGGFRLEVMVHGNYTDKSIWMQAGPAYFCFFNPDLSVAEMKFESVSMRLRENLVDAGKMRPKSIETWLSELKEGVRYWNGTGWQKGPSTVRGRPDA